MIEGPDKLGEHWVWSDDDDDVAVRFVGRGPVRSRSQILHDLAREQLDLAALEQRHTAICHAVVDGTRAPVGDALWTARSYLALSIVTADCVPLLLADDTEVAAVHAGWRGIAGGVVGAALERFSGPHSTLRAWIGPAIGSCCYEVGEEVAAEVAAASAPRVVSWPHGRPRRPHLDLALAVTLQLEAAGVNAVKRVSACTRCESDLLWSYRREGPGKGRNLALIWRR